MERGGPRDAARQRHRRPRRAAPQKDRFGSAGEADPYRARCRIYPAGERAVFTEGGGLVMRLRRPRGVRVSLTFWYVGAMMVVLALYAAVVFMFVSRNLSLALNDQLRSDFQWAAAMADQRPDGTLTWFDDDRNGGEGSQWFQAWAADGIVFRTAVAERNPIPESERLVAQADPQRIVAVSV